MLRFVLTILAMVAGGIVQADTKVPQTQAEISLGFAPLVKQAAPAVVNIYAKRITQARPSPFTGDPFFEEFFRGFAEPRPRVQNSLGSGVILSADGIVVSNYHVVGMATEINVVLSDRREYSAQVLLGDKSSDLAILKLDDAENLPFLQLRDSDRIEVGELVLAIGNPFGVGQTVSSGIISGLARSGAVAGGGRGYFIQTDAPINPGNSGGALVDVNGQLIGINTRILSRSGGSNGIGFAIPANLVAQFVAQSQDGHDQFQRPWAGMAGQPVDADLATSLGMTIPEGILIADMHPLSPFAKAGFKVGDVISAVDGDPVHSPQEMLFRMSVVGIGGIASVTRQRLGEVAQVEVGMMLPPDDPPREVRVLKDDSVLPGLEVAQINPAVIAEYNLPLQIHGVVVLNAGRYGNRVGVQRGDVLLSINGSQIKSSDDVMRAFDQAGRRVTIDALRRGKRISLRFRL